MKSLWIWICVLDICLVSSYLTFHGHKVLRVQLKTKEHVTLIQSMDKKFNLDFWHPDSSARIVPMMTVDIHIHANQSESVLQQLKHSTVPFQVLFHDLQEGIEAQLDNRKVRNSKKYSYSKYNDWKTIADWTCKVASNHPDLVKRLEIGNTFEGRPMYVLKVGKQRSAETAIFLECGVHAREWISPAFCQWFVRELVTGYSNDESIKELLRDLTFYILPVFNIDGYTYTWTKDRIWRKNRSPAPGGECCCTDLNRNFNISWCEIGSSDDPCTEIYCGHSAESEKETKNVATFIRRNLDSIKAYISIHSYSQMLLYPYSYTYDPAPNSEELDEISKGAVSELHSLYGTKYVYGPSASTIYPTAGSSDDWAYTQGIKYAFTFELRDKGKHGFLLPESQIKPTCRETALAIKYIANYVLAHPS